MAGIVLGARVFTHLAQVHPDTYTGEIGFGVMDLL